MTKMCERQDAAINKLLDRLQEEHEERDELKRLLKLCVKDLYSPSGKFKKNTALEVMKYINQPSEQGENWYE